MNVPWAVWVRESMTTDLVLDALEMGIWQRQRGRHSIRGARSSFRRWFPIHLDPLLRTARRGRRATLDWVGDSYDNAMAESIIGLFKPN